MFDQRAAGRSTPHAGDDDVHWASIDMTHHVADMERLRVHLGIDQWAVFGISWGSVLGMTYAQRHPERVSAVVLAAVSTGTAADIDWLTVNAGRFFPQQWQEFRNHVPPELRHPRLVDAYHRILMDPDPAVRDAAAVAWCRWEDAHVATTQNAQPNPRYDDPQCRLGFARQVTHCWSNNSWLADNEIIKNIGRLTDIPGWLCPGPTPDIRVVATRHQTRSATGRSWRAGGPSAFGAASTVVRPLRAEPDGVRSPSLILRRPIGRQRRAENDSCSGHHCSHVRCDQACRQPLGDAGLCSPGCWVLPHDHAGRCRLRWSGRTPDCRLAPEGRPRGRGAGSDRACDR